MILINLLYCFKKVYVQSNPLLIADVSENFRNACLEIYDINPGHFLTAPGLAWQAVLKNTKVKLDLLTDIDMLFMLQNISEEEYITIFINMQKPITNT